MGCMALSTAIFVGESQNWIDELVTKAEQLKLGAGTDTSADVGPVISPAAKSRIENLIASGHEQGASLVLDGRNPTVEGYESGNFVGPTIISDVTTEMDCYKQEIFGPALVILKADTLDDAV